MSPTVQVKLLKSIVTSASLRCLAWPTRQCPGSGLLLAGIHSGQDPDHRDRPADSAEAQAPKLV